MKTKTLILLAIILVVPLVIAQPTYKQNTEINLNVPCTNNGSTCSGTATCEAMVIDPTGSVLVNNQSMALYGGFANYNLSSTNTSTIGQYELTICCKDGSLTQCKTLEFEVTGTGFEFNQAKSLAYFIFLLVLTGLFVLSIGVAAKLPTRDATDEYGMLLSINKLKYLKPVLFAVAWALLLAVVFISSNLALAYFGTELVGQVLFNIWRIMMLISVPGVVILGAYMIINIFRDQEVKKMIERGIDIPGSP